ncbi:MAG: FxsA family protein [Cellvibrionaceae bacterium]|nr:FxsA family protein [Cellvibrionaceae bacterium]
MRFLLFFFISVPLIEMWLLIQVGGVIGALPTIGLVLLTACIGVALLRYQGIAALAGARKKLQSHQLPIRELADGVFFAVGGALLLTPGFITDAMGFACLIPGVRSLLIGALSQFVLRSVHAKASRASDNAQDPSSEGDIIEGDFKRHKD